MVPASTVRTPAFWRTRLLIVKTALSASALFCSTAMNEPPCRLTVPTVWALVLAVVEPVKRILPLLRLMAAAVASWTFVPLVVRAALPMTRPVTWPAPTPNPVLKILKAVLLIRGPEPV